VKSTGVGAGIGAIATRSAKGPALALALALPWDSQRCCSRRGPEVELPRGTTVDIITDRAIYLDANRVNFTDPARIDIAWSV